MRRFGSDKPDLRFGNEIVDVTEFFKETSFTIFQSEFVGAVVMPGGALQARRELDAWQEWAKARGAKGLAYILVGENGDLSGPVAKNLSERERSGIADAAGAKPNDAIFFAAGARMSSLELLGAARLAAGAAQRAGAGMVYLSTPGAGVDPEAPTEAVSQPMGTSDWADELLARSERFHAFVVGPGLGRSEETTRQVRQVLRQADRPLVLDGDGLFALEIGRAHV